MGCELPADMGFLPMLGMNYRAYLPESVLRGSIYHIWFGKLMELIFSPI